MGLLETLRVSQELRRLEEEKEAERKRRGWGSGGISFGRRK